ncbi:MULTISPECIES: polysaccharide biosynthesis C-terminal domain-containing protein [unclassified Pseudomonas]|uniref:lipopolysaccharide biosynthesis protein n=1 Tax=unclassified Pseudomonas TaxID=196821 RepID=UPI0013149DC3|nr:MULTISPECIES: polysaccharide biosynthesis C-terminal domain-containing protein [unclassified Pseudomonas]
MELVQRQMLLKRLTPLMMQWGVTAYSAAVSLGLSVLFARSMGSSAFGHYTYIYVLASVLVLAQDAGFNTLLLRERAAPSASLRSHCSQLPTVAVLHLLVTTGLFIVFAGVCSKWIDAPSLMSGIVCFAAIMLMQWQSSWLKGSGKFERDAVFLFCSRTVSAIFVLVAVLTIGPSPSVIFLAWSAGLLLSLALHYRHFPTLAAIEWQFPTWAYRSSLTFFAVGLASTLYHQIDIIILRNLLGEIPAIGHYAVATRIHDGLMLLATPVVLMLFRRMRVLAMQPGAGNRFSRNAVIGALLIGTCLAVVGWIFGPWIVGILFGNVYAEGAHKLIQLLFLALVFALPNFVLEQNAIATQNERLLAFGFLLAVAINVALNFYLIPTIGVEGAAWATILTEVVLCAILTHGLRREVFS